MRFDSTRAIGRLVLERGGCRRDRRPRLWVVFRSRSIRRDRGRDPMLRILVLRERSRPRRSPNGYRRSSSESILLGGRLIFQGLNSARDLAIRRFPPLVE